MTDAAGTIEVRELADRRLALLSADYQSRRELDAALRAEHLVPRIAYEDVHPEALVVLARRGVAVAVIVNDALPRELDMPVAELRHRGKPLGGRLSLLWRDETTLSTSARRFRDVVLEAAAAGARTPAKPRVRAASRPRRRQATRAR